MSELEDFEFHKSDEETDASRQGEGRLRRLVLAAVVLVLLGLAAVSYVFLRGPRAPAAARPPVAAATITPPTTEPPLPLPALDGSDPLVRDLLKAISGHPLFGAWLQTKDLVRNVALVVESVVSGENPSPHLQVLAPKGRFQVVKRKGRILADPKNYARYDLLTAAIGSLDAPLLAGAFTRVEPLLDAAWRELGHQDGRFRIGLTRALAILEDTPIPEAEMALNPVLRGILVYEYADRRLEGLAPAQKQLLRLGPRNARAVQAKLRELAQALALATGPSGVGR